MTTTLLRRVGVLAAALLLAGCGGSGTVTASEGAATPAPASPSSTEPSSTGPSSGPSSGTATAGPTTAGPTSEGPTGGTDCSALTDAAATLGLAVQLMPQLTSTQSYDSIRSGVLPYDPAAVTAAIATLRALEAYPTSLGSVRDSLDTYAEANNLVAANLQQADPFAGSGGQDLIDLTSDVTGFMTLQAPLSQALEAAGCS